MRSHPKVVLFLALFLTFGFLSSVAAEFKVKLNITAARSQEMMPSELLVKFKSGVSANEIAALHARHGALELAVSRFSGVRRIKIPPGKAVADMVAAYAQNPNVEYAEPNYIAHAFMVPDDTYFLYQWHFEPINLEEAWDVSTGNGVVVAVVDTGIAYEDYQQPVQINRVKWGTIDYSHAPDLAQTGFVQGYDFINNDTHPNDDEGHGTHVAGTIAQSTNNNLGVAGIAFNASLMPVKVLDNTGSGSYDAIADGIYYAADNGADVINLSLGGSSPSITLENALAYAYEEGVTIVCASGNDGYADSISYPAAYDAYCLAVGATRYDDTVTGYSNRGSSLDLTAPGGDTSVDQDGDGYPDGILQQTFGDDPAAFDYYFYQGTSMAAPHVSGVAALLISQDPSRTPNEIRAILQESATDLGQPGWDPDYGWGRLDAAAALNPVAVSNTRPVAKIVAPPDGEEDVALSFDGSESYDDDGDSLTYVWDFGDGLTGAGGTVTHAYSAGGRYNVTLTVNDGKEDSTDTWTVVIKEVNDPPVADAGSDRIVQVNEVVHFDAANSYDIDDGIATYSWDFDDGSSASGEMVDHGYTTPGSYTVTLTVTDYVGAEVSDVVSVEVTDISTVSPLSSEIEIALDVRKAGKNLFASAVATVFVADESGAPIDSVVVSGYWNNNPEVLMSATTDVNGEAVFRSEEIKSPLSGTVFTFTITETLKAGFETVPDGEVSDSITY
ncbi:MAG: S8 family serine peptidase [Desulfuromonadaceae bacterium]|nr:S8 family serine peptidase [Desulfuromonadaceae bacterium]